jgi:hypothetical protein
MKIEYIYFKNHSEQSRHEMTHTVLENFLFTHKNNTYILQNIKAYERKILKDKLR